MGNLPECRMDTDEIALADATAIKAVGSRGVLFGFHNVNEGGGNPSYYYSKLEKAIRSGHKRSFDTLVRIASCPLTSTSIYAMSLLEELKKEGIISYILKEK